MHFSLINILRVKDFLIKRSKMTYLFLPMRLKKNTVNAITNTTKNIPTPMPVLKIPPTTEQLEKVARKRIDDTAISF